MKFDDCRIVQFNDERLLNEIEIAPGDLFILDVREDGYPYYIHGNIPNYSTCDRCHRLNSKNSICYCRNPVKFFFDFKFLKLIDLSFFNFQYFLD